MSGSRIPGAKGAPNSSRSRDQNKLKPRRFIGVDLSGGKNDRTSVAVLDYYSEQKKLFLTHIYEHIQQEGDISSDQALFETINDHTENLEYLCIDAPLKFPICVRCQLRCPGYEKCKVKEIQWMWKQHKKRKETKPRTRLFTPYTQRAAELYIANETGENVNPMEALGANIAPLTARALFLLRRLANNIRVIEVYPMLTVSRVGKSLKIAKSHLSHYKHQVGGDESRQVILQELVKRDLVFIYQQDFLKLIENSHSFDAFISAFTGFLKYHDQCEKPPKDFPVADSWIEFPVKNPELF